MPYSYAGSAILFFGYDAGVMALVYTNPDYLRHVGLYNGTGTDAAAVGGLVSLWFGGFSVGMCPCLVHILFISNILINPSIRCNTCGIVCRQDW
jgi:hypothetical protein